MEDLVLQLTRGNVTEVKVVLASVLVALALYQLVLIALVYGRIRMRFLAGAAAAVSHRSIGDVILVLAAVVATMCIAVFGFEAEEGAGAVHVVSATAFLVLLALKVLLIRTNRGGGALPYLGSTVFVLLGLTWGSSAGALLLG